MTDYELIKAMFERSYEPMVECNKDESMKHMLLVMAEPPLQRIIELLDPDNDELKGEGLGQDARLDAVNEIMAVFGLSLRKVMAQHLVLAEEQRVGNQRELKPKTVSNIMEALSQEEIDAAKDRLP